MSNTKLSVIIIAAGKGSRMKSKIPKVLHKVANRSMLNLVIDTACLLKPSDISVVISQDLADFTKEISNSYSNKINFFIQNKRLGTAHAVDTAIRQMSKISDKILILYGDTPLIKLITLQNMLEKLNDNAICTLAFNMAEFNAYGRLIIDNQGYLDRIVEFKDANEKEKEIKLCNSGVVAVKGKYIKTLLKKIDNKNANKEYYLTDIITIAKLSNLKCSFIITNKNEVIGVNSRQDLAQIENNIQNRLREEFMSQGVTLIKPDTVFFSYDTKIDNDVTIYPNVYFGLNVKIKSDVIIKSGPDICCTE